MRPTGTLGRKPWAASTVLWLLACKWHLPRRRHIGDAAYYSYTAPEPDGLHDQPLSAGAWVESGSGSLAILPYEAVRIASNNPKTTLLAFCQSAYEAGARLAGWDTTSFESTWCPTPDHLKQLQANAAAEFGRTNDGCARGSWPSPAPAITGSAVEDHRHPQVLQSFPPTSPRQA